MYGNDGYQGHNAHHGDLLLMGLAIFASSRIGPLVMLLLAAWLFS
jgi:hypothetical protein